MGVSAVAREQVVAGFERGEQVKCGNGAPRTVRFPSFARQYQRWTSIFLDYAGRGDPDHTPVPPFAFDHHAIGISQGGLFFQPALNAFEDAAFFVLAICVEPIESRGNFAGAFDIFHAEKFHYIAGSIHPSGSIQARRNAKGDFG